MDRASIISRTTDSARNEVAPETFKNDRRSPQQDSIVQINASRFQESEISEHSNVKRVETVGTTDRSEEHTSELQSQSNLVCRLLLDKKNGPPKACTLRCPASASGTRGRSRSRRRSTGPSCSCRSEEPTSELQSQSKLACRLPLEPTH